MRPFLTVLRHNPQLGHRVHASMHVLYFVLVLFEAHGFYRWAAGSLAITGIVAIIKGGEV